MADLVDELWASDEASALTNRAAREIERLEAAHEAVRKEVFDTQYAGLGHRTNAEKLCSEILRITHEVLEPPSRITPDTSSPSWMPSDCHDRNSCHRHGSCQYIGCSGQSNSTAVCSLCGGDGQSREVANDGAPCGGCNGTGRVTQGQGSPGSLNERSEESPK